MAKVLLVEDDNNLREIYQARLMAEGYDIVTAQNGEEALVVAKQHKPDLIISDVMMPRISGFEMLDILRNTAELKHTKVIMLTALGQDDDQQRADSLGANRYLVKSQVTLEDIVNAAKELLSEDGSATPAPAAPSASTDAGAIASSMVAPAAPGIAAIAHVSDAGAPATPPVSAVEAPVAVQPAPVPVAAPPADLSPAAAPIDSPTPVASADPPAAPAPTPDPIQPTVVTPVAVEPEPAVPSGPTTPAEPPAPGVVDKAAQGLEAEEAALQAQIASYSQPGDNADGAAAPAQATATSNDQALADAVKQLNTPETATPATAPDLASASVDNTQPAPAPANPDSSAQPGTDPASPTGRKVIQPIGDPSGKPDLNALLAKEEAANPTPAAPFVNGAPGAAQTPPPAATPGQAFDPNTSL